MFAVHQNLVNCVRTQNVRVKFKNYLDAFTYLLQVAYFGSNIYVQYIVHHWWNIPHDVFAILNIDREHRAECSRSKDTAKYRYLTLLGLLL